MPRTQAGYELYRHIEYTTARHKEVASAERTALDILDASLAAADAELEARLSEVLAAHAARRNRIRRALGELDRLLGAPPAPAVGYDDPLPNIVRG